MARKIRDDATGGVIMGGGIALLALLMSIGAWAGTMSISSAAVAPGKVAAEGNRKAVQHRDGGSVKAVLVREGQKVKVGEPLIELDLSETQAEFNVLTATKFQGQARRARLAAELAATELAFPDDLVESATSDPRAQSAMDQERALFEARSVAFEGAVALYRQQISGGRDQIEALTGKLEATKRQLASLEKQKQSLEPLAEKGIIAKNQILELERGVAELEGSIQATLTELAAQKSKVSEAEIEIAQLTKTRREEASKEMTDVENQLSSTRPRLAAATDLLKRSVIASPEEGFVYNLQIFSTGATVAPSQTVMEIVPANEPLVLAVEVDPADIERVHPGQDAVVHLLPYNQRYQSVIRGRLERVAADRVDDEQQKRSFYTATVSVNQADLERANAELLPGMPVQVMINAGDRTIARYLLDPVLKVYDFAMRED